MLNIRKQNTAWKLASVLLLTMLVAVLIGSGTLDAAAKGLTDLVQRIWVGDFTWAVQNTPSDDVSAETKPARTVTVESRGDLWILRTSIGNFGGDALPGHDLEVKQFDAISDAQAIVNYDICQPGYLPAGYELQVVMLTPMDWVFQFYGVGDEGLVVAQAPVGEVPGNEEGHLTSVGIGLLTDKQIESVILNGQTAGWVDGYGLIWETNGMSFSVGDPELSREEIIRIAESLE